MTGTTSTAAALLLACMMHSAEGFMPASFMAPSSLAARATSRAAGRASPISVYMDAALILQNKGGGHGEIGYHLAQQLKAKGLDVTVLQDSAAKMDKLPFKDYGGLGVEIISLDLSDVEEVKKTVANRKYTHVFDNFAKDESSLSLGQLAANWGVKSFVYVSSAGMYKSDVAQPMTEDGATKETGQRAVEKYLDLLGLPWTSFRPQYIYGPKTNKRDYLDWFVDRIVRDRTCPLPGDGNQRASVTNVEDVASMMVSVVGKEEAAARQIFNCGTDSYVTYREICELVAKTAGKTAKISTYNPKDFDLPKGAFPFRNEEFAVSPDKAKSILGWSRKHNLAEDLDWYIKDYINLGLATKEKTFESDDIILGSRV
mmetsp:Transcript_56793/g.139393  ORF Transcript_56793/g.139393 Transcript_56793/m.139393 type:complete len:371 (-) Transcript_56793:50-1162(-)|eukprot:CAMPEP_0206252976 /NCGR_PEP_ID=MMETSP0047_2-20121206/22904_1 /ASSEMBLY_ACC=CAM_ASM_000192 /TAXON_ID=195065 /ORGANISM="Chroomonas mesostigmatica_cf, Strain CCMP1168" /LENGTH=370 /DNA_ID=CAMNT_0053679151 /DNA_START=25 /DNA_END=1137 /DNA_ORIENTATION=-